MTWKLIKDIGSKEYKVGDIVPDKLGNRLDKMFKIGHTDQRHVEKVIEDKKEPVKKESKKTEPMDINKDGKVDFKDVIEVAKKAVSKTTKKKSITKRRSKKKKSKK